MQEEISHNEAFIDGQNLYINTAANGWRVDLKKFRIYLRDQYQVREAYYFLGVANNANRELYELIQESGYTLVFREHCQSMTGKKKGNVDTDIVFTIMAKIADRADFGEVILVSGDGDYFKMVKYLVEKGRFRKLLSPNRHSTSTLYRKFAPKFVDFLDKPGIKKKIEYSK